MIITSNGMEFRNIDEMRGYRKALVNQRSANMAAADAAIINIDIEIEKSRIGQAQTLRVIK